MVYPYHELYIYHELSTIAYLSIFHEACIHTLYGLSSYLSIYYEPFIPFTMSPSFYPSILHPSLHLDLVFSLVIGIKLKATQIVNPLMFQNIQKHKKIKISQKILKKKSKYSKNTKKSISNKKSKQ